MNKSQRGNKTHPKPVAEKAPAVTEEDLAAAKEWACEAATVIDPIQRAGTVFKSYQGATRQKAVERLHNGLLQFRRDIYDLCHSQPEPRVFDFIERAHYGHEPIAFGDHEYHSWHHLVWESFQMFSAGFLELFPEAGRSIDVIGEEELISGFARILDRPVGDPVTRIEKESEALIEYLRQSNTAKEASSIDPKTAEPPASVDTSREMQQEQTTGHKVLGGLKKGNEARRKETESRYAKLAADYKRERNSNPSMSRTQVCKRVASQQRQQTSWRTVARAAKKTAAGNPRIPD